MSEGILIFIGVVVWLGMGGYAFARCNEEVNIPKDLQMVLFGFCFLMAPFALGIILASPSIPKPNDHKE
jgi:hypothetical protein